MTNITDLRSALKMLKQIDGQYHETDVPVDPHAELSGVYRHIGGGGTIKRPTRTGPAMMFNTIKGFDDARILIGMLGSRERVGHLLGTDPERIGFKLNDALNTPVEPVVVNNKQAKCQEVVHLASDPGFDIRKLIPATTNTLEDAGPFITMGLVYAQDPLNNDQNVTIHRQCLQAADEISMYFVPGRHIDIFRQHAENAGKSLAITVNIGLDPAIYIASCFEPPTTPLGFNELSIAGGLRNTPVELCQAVSVETLAVANAEIVIEGEFIPGKRVKEDQNTQTGKAMPEFPGYNGGANPSLPVFKVKAVTHRINPIMQTTIGPSEEHVNLAGIPTEASIIQMVERALPGRLQNVYAHACGGGKLTAVLQFKKNGIADEGRHRQAAIIAFAAFPELKNIFLVDEDVDLFDSNDVLWALSTRFQGDVDIINIPGVRCHPLDPSQRPEMSPSIPNAGISCKTIFDCTVPVSQKDNFHRAKFLEVDHTRFL